MPQEYAYVIVIPIYKSTLSDFEKKALRQVSALFSVDRIRLIAPESISEDYSNQLQIERFPNKFFRNTQSYNDLLVSSSFYRRFLKYKYMLIYQLDAYIFSQDIERWIRLNFSYIGAPWIYADSYQLKVKEYRKMGLKFPEVGNGGLSLREIRIHYYSCLLFSTFILRKIFKSYNEDWFWCAVINKINPFYRIAPLKVAQYFAIESEPAKAMNDIDGQLPFGCHAWGLYYESFWKKYI